MRCSPISLALTPFFLLMMALAPEAVSGDWLLTSEPAPARVIVAEDGRQLVMTNGLLTRTFLIRPDACTIGLDDLTGGASLVRAVEPEARVTIDGVTLDVGGLIGQPDHAFIAPSWLADLEVNPRAMHFTGYDLGEIEARMPFTPVRHHAPGTLWPPRGVALHMRYRLTDPPSGLLDTAAPAERNRRLGSLGKIEVTVHYALYDAMPLLAKWITVENGSDHPVTLDRFTSEILAVVEPASWLEECGQKTRFDPPLHVETDYAFAAGNATQCLHSVHWVADPEYLTQVDYQRRTRCLLEVGPSIGPAQEISPGESFTSFRAFELVHDSTDRERRGLAVRRMYRTLAPWVTENPLMLHVRYADPKSVENAIDQCARVGFEMMILTFGSGFNIEDDSRENLARMKLYADHARAKGIEIGGYSLLASRHVGGGNDVVMPPGRRPTFGNSPCLQSDWGRDYFAKLYRFFEQTGFMLLEHDGSYPGDPCVAEDHPGHNGYEDSRWAQWRLITEFYHWCRKRGIYLNVPDWYYLSGSNKSGMGYRETNWSLPRPLQVIHTRQNIYDGTFLKTPSMGWMFVPLVQYHGGGAAATIEPLSEHIGHYEAMLTSNLGFGVQACYRGPRLYDTPQTEAMVAGWVRWFKSYRDILESDVIHGRRADGRDLDWVLHVNPRLSTRGMLLVFNPLEQPVTRTIDLNLYYTGLETRVQVSHEGEQPARYTLRRDYSILLEVSVPPRAMTWYLIAPPL